MDYYNLPLNTSGAQLRQTLEADFGGRLRRHFGGRGPVPSVVRRGGPDRFGGPNKAILPRSGGAFLPLRARRVSLPPAARPHRPGGRARDQAKEGLDRNS